MHEDRAYRRFPPGPSCLDREGCACKEGGSRGEDGDPNCRVSQVSQTLFLAYQEARKPKSPREPPYDGPYVLDISTDGNINVRLMKGEKVFSKPFIRCMGLYPQAATVDVDILKDVRRKVYKKTLDRPLLLYADVITLEGQILLEHVYLTMLEEAWAPSENIHIVVLCPTSQTPQTQSGFPLRLPGAVHSIGYALAGSLLPDPTAAGMSLAGSSIANTKVPS